MFDIMNLLKLHIEVCSLLKLQQKVTSLELETYKVLGFIFSNSANGLDSIFHGFICRGLTKTTVGPIPGNPNGLPNLFYCSTRLYH